MKRVRLFIGALATLVHFCVASQTVADLATDERRIRDLVLRDVISQGLEKTPEVQAALRAAQEAVLMRAWEQKILAARGVTTELKAMVYQELSDMLGNAEYRIFHVFTGEEQGARALVARMKASREWAKIDLDAVFGQKGKHTLRQTDWINLSAVLPEFRGPLKAMKAGDVVTQPIRAKDGWHVVGMMETRPFKLPPAEQMSTELQRLAERRIVGEKIKALLTNNKE